MPRIAAATVREHREQMVARLLEAAEQILREGRTLTVGGVASQVGIARNSVYRYVDSVDDLQAMVLNQYLPRWAEAVVQAMAADADPRAQVLAYVRANLEQAAPGGLAWVMTMASQQPDKASEALAGVHDQLAQALRSAVQSRDWTHQELLIKIVDGITLAGFARLAAGDAPDQVIEVCVRSVAGALPR